MRENDRILLLWDRFGDYHRARWRALQQLVGEEKVFGADLGGADEKYKWKSNENSHQYCLLSEQPVEVPDEANRFSNLVACIEQNHITVLCLGYGRKEYRKYALYAKRKGLKVVIFSESWYPRKYPFDLIKGISLRWLADGFLLSGERAYNHFTRRLGIPPERVRLGYDTVDNQHFSRDEQSVPQENILLCVARYDEVKNLKLLIRAFLQSRLSKTWQLKLVGDGPLKEELLALTKDTTSITLSDWVAYDALPRYYHQARLLVLPSTFEPWGLVVNEAMAAGLPVIASEAVGAASDLVTERNGATFAADDESTLRDIFDAYAAMGEEAMNAQGEASVELIRKFSPDIWAKNLVSLI